MSPNTPTVSILLPVLKANYAQYLSSPYSLRRYVSQSPIFIRPKLIQIRTTSYEIPPRRHSGETRGLDSPAPLLFYLSG